MCNEDLITTALINYDILLMTAFAYKFLLKYCKVCYLSDQHYMMTECINMP